MSLVATAAVIAVVGLAVASATSKKSESSPMILTIQPYRARAEKALTQAFDVDPVSDEALEKTIAAVVSRIRTSTNEIDLRTDRNMVSKVSVDRIAAGMPTAGKNYSDAALAINDLAAAIEAAKFATSKDMTTDPVKVGAGLGGTPFTSLARGLSATRGAGRTTPDSTGWLQYTASNGKYWYIRRLPAGMYEGVAAIRFAGQRSILGSTANEVREKIEAQVRGGIVSGERFAPLGPR